MMRKRRRSCNEFQQIRSYRSGRGEGRKAEETQKREESEQRESEREQRRRMCISNKLLDALQPDPEVHGSRGRGLWDPEAFNVFTVGSTPTITCHDISILISIYYIYCVHARQDGAQNAEKDCLLRRKMSISYDKTIL